MFAHDSANHVQAAATACKRVINIFVATFFIRLVDP